jgi:hypothetical protein
VGTALALSSTVCAVWGGENDSEISQPGALIARSPLTMAWAVAVAVVVMYAGALVLGTVSSVR